MKIKNTSETIISFGKTVILPDETAEVDDSYNSNASVALLAKMKRIKIMPIEHNPVIKPKPEVKKTKGDSNTAE